MNKAKVILAGAGCGDAELITIKLQRYLQIANVIIADRLVNKAIINEYANKNATIIIAGKQGYNSTSFTQEEVTNLIIKHAVNNNLVLRLKGGDIAFFSNVLHELEALVANNLNYEIIPGITAASGASAYAGIPLTARGYSLGVQFITFNPTNNEELFTANKWKQLASTTDTLAIYMGAKNMAQLVQGLLNNGIKIDTPIAIIEKATTANQKVHVSVLINCLEQFKDVEFSSPTLIIIGKVVELHKKFNWFNSGNTNTTIFPEL